MEVKKKGSDRRGQREKERERRRVEGGKEEVVVSSQKGMNEQNSQINK